MEKAQAVASLGEQTPALAGLLRPAQVRTALQANDRLKLYLTVLQAAAAHAQAPHAAALDLRAEIQATDVQARGDADWLHDLPATASGEGQGLRLPDWPRLAARLADDLAVMARPVIEAPEADAELTQRVGSWTDALRAASGSLLTPAALNRLTHGQRQAGDSLHLTVMDLHKALNRLASQRIDGASCWQLAADGSDDARVAAFMRGVNRTRPLKGEHPGLDTAATRADERLLIQNDIGTNDAHVLVLQVDTRSERPVTTLTYSDLHRQRFAFFQRLLEAVGAVWHTAQTVRLDGLNRGDAYHLGTARFEAGSEAQLAEQLDGIGARIVFLIDWNRARKRLLPFVDKAGAVRVLEAAAAAQSGHMAWLVAGGERLIWAAMAAQGPAAFRLGDRLDDVLGAATAEGYLIDVLIQAAQVAHGGASDGTLLADQARALLARRLQGRRGEFDLMQEHAAYCHALAQGLHDALVHGLLADAQAATRLAARARTWERQADQIVQQARSLAERQPQWQALADLLARGDDVADALEEAAFALTLLAGRDRLGAPAAATLIELAGCARDGVQEHIKALAMAATLEPASHSDERNDFLAACWRVQQAERRGDDLLRGVRHALVTEGDALTLTLTSDVAAALEDATDALAAASWGLKKRALHRMEVNAA